MDLRRGQRREQRIARRMSVGTSTPTTGGRSEFVGDGNADFAGEPNRRGRAFSHERSDIFVGQWLAGAAEFFRPGHFYTRSQQMTIGPVHPEQGPTRSSNWSAF